jgi:hypothetical protein
VDGQGNFICKFERHARRLEILAGWKKSFHRAIGKTFGPKTNTVQPILILGGSSLGTKHRINKSANKSPKYYV